MTKVKLIEFNNAESSPLYFDSIKEASTFLGVKQSTLSAFRGLENYKYSGGKRRCGVANKNTGIRYDLKRIKTHQK
jgi:hypothetical protein